MAYLGIDVSQDKLEVVLVRDGYPAERGQFDNQRQGFAQLHHFLQQRQVQPVYTGLEAVGHYGDALATYLYNMGYTVSMVSPAQLKGYADRCAKTDTSAAALIADFCRTQYPPTWTPPAPTAQDVQALVRQLASLQPASQPADNHQQSGSSYWGRLLNRGRKSQPV